MQLCGLLIIKIYATVLRLHISKWLFRVRVMIVIMFCRSTVKDSPISRVVLVLWPLYTHSTNPVLGFPMQARRPKQSCNGINHQILLSSKSHRHRLLLFRTYAFLRNIGVKISLATLLQQELQ